MSAPRAHAQRREAVKLPRGEAFKRGTIGASHHVGMAVVSGTPPIGGVRVTVRPTSRASAAKIAELTTAAPPGSLLK